ncbi:hypothetical protein OHB39_36365 [Streptomyces sp. NBC_00047]|uniref:hypothetical protein n=1 Tax=Streptomyces sp. NBC_00047 TaxID=2975627 RepID=UPI002250506E|nr:hypothetical protein [Streptomyces sp. NBC_00047]MCX5612988.1 hypothetical protein [Streptomyces sp. NBC_00047]
MEEGQDEMYDVFTNWMAGVLASLTLLAAGFLWRWLRRRRAGTDVPPAAGTMRTYTLLGARAADGQPAHLPSNKPAGTVVTWTGPAGPERFELTDGVLPDGTYAADRTALYRRR